MEQKSNEGCRFKLESKCYGMLFLPGPFVLERDAQSLAPPAHLRPSPLAQKNRLAGSHTTFWLLPLSHPRSPPIHSPLHTTYSLFITFIPSFALSTISSSKIIIRNAGDDRSVCTPIQTSSQHATVTATLQFYAEAVDPVRIDPSTHQTPLPPQRLMNRRNQGMQPIHKQQAVTL